MLINNFELSQVVIARLTGATGCGRRLANAQPFSRAPICWHYPFLFITLREVPSNGPVSRS